jgi:hypothetical protein
MSGNSEDQTDWLGCFQSLLHQFDNDELLRAKLRESERSLTNEQRQTMTRLRFGLNHPDFDGGDTLFFMSGLFKAGTTWLGLLLNAHPGLVCGPREIHSFSAQVTELYLNKPLSELPAAEAKVWRENLLNARRSALFWQIISTADKPSARRLGGRGPVANLRLLIEAFPKVRIPIIMRDGRDIAVSAAFFHGNYYNQSYERFFLDSEQTKLNPSYVQGWAGQFRDFYRMALAVAAEHPQAVKVIRYEDLLARPVPIMQELYSWLSVSDDAALVERCVDRCSFETMTQGRQRGQADNSSFFRKGTAGDWRNHFTSESVDVFKATAGDFLIESGYEPNDHWSIEH